MERSFVFKTTKIICKELPGSVEGNEKYKTKRIDVKFVCDLDDIKFVDHAVKNDGQLYKTKCIIYHTSKGDILVNHKFEDVNQILKNKYKTSYITIKGFKK